LHLKAGIKAALSAGIEVVLKAGASSLVLNPAGVFVNGPVINLTGGGMAGAAVGARQAPLPTPHPHTAGQPPASPHAAPAADPARPRRPDKVTLPRQYPPPANDPDFGKAATKVGTRILPRILGTTGGLLFTDNERPVVQWQEGDVTYTHNKDDFSLVAKHPDGRTEHYVLRPDGVLWSGDHAYVVGVMAPDGNITPVSAQDDVAYRSWLANGGEGSYHEWVAQGKPAEVVQGIDQAPAGTVRDRNVKGPNNADDVVNVQRFDRKAITEGFQDHHILSDKNKLTQNHELLDLAGFDLQKRQNKIFLPTDETLHPTRSIHSGRHTTQVSRNLAEQMDAVVEVGKQQGWTQQQYQKA